MSKYVENGYRLLQYIVVSQSRYEVGLKYFTLMKLLSYIVVVDVIEAVSVVNTTNTMMN